MKIAITASKPDLSSPVDPRFGRCPYFIIVDLDTMEFEANENTNLYGASGVGIQSAQFIANKGVKALLTGSCGPNAFQTLQAAGVEVIVGVSGTVQEAATLYKEENLKSTPQANVPSHFGMGVGRGSGMGGGMGRGMGQGQGMGMGRGMGQGQGMGMGRGMAPEGAGMPPFSPNPPSIPPEDEAKTLQQQAEYLQQQLNNITKRIEELKKMK
jgi:predicted Fe-Mo cluster-binding NifX family protein